MKELKEDLQQKDEHLRDMQKSSRRTERNDSGRKIVKTRPPLDSLTREFEKIQNMLANSFQRLEDSKANSSEQAPCSLRVTKDTAFPTPAKDSDSAPSSRRGWAVGKN
eukprot:TRINITY_DN3141_c0_g1_i3.p1 TRINITY_DN3141_c0_g1~~TRINITY_DN3141_c0_g1_i3.p1  ORF type:complete len:108 (+),score=26.23 TRINITY_DN3141_c0_g1_i3:464-787(+)